MKELIEIVAGFVPAVQSSPIWVKTYFVVWACLTLGLIISVIFTLDTRKPNDLRKIPVIYADNNPAQPGPPASGFLMTGDLQIDKTLAALNALAATRNVTDGQRIQALQHQFYKPVYQNLLEDSPERALFAFCQAKTLLHRYGDDFAAADVRRAILEATQNLIALQNQLASLFGSGFQPQQQCDAHRASLADYLSAMPKRINDRLVGEQFENATKTLAHLRAKLQVVGLMGP